MTLAPNAANMYLKVYPENQAHPNISNHQRSVHGSKILCKSAPGDGQGLRGPSRCSIRRLSRMRHILPAEVFDALYLKAAWLDPGPLFFPEVGK